MVIESFSQLCYDLKKEGMDLTQPTIAAIATPPGPGGIAILRISGPDAAAVLAAFFRPAGSGTVSGMPSHQLTYGHVLDTEGQVVDEAMAVLMRAPRSYTREDVAEVHSHGGPVIAQRLLALALAHGAAPAGPGDFTRRAFENGRIDLSQAEAVMQLIGAGSARAAQAAARQLSGGVSRQIAEIRQGVIQALAGIEAVIDFPEEVSEAEAVASLLPDLKGLAQRLRSACDPKQARVLREGLQVVLVGRPNAGKSSLLNALLETDRAIVTDIPGTTRDILTESLWLDGVLLHLSDTAGLGEGEDVVERIGMERTRKAVEEADVCLFVLDAARPWQAAYQPLLTLPTPAAKLVVLSKGDLPPVLGEAEVLAHLAEPMPVLTLSAKEGQGLSQLTQALLSLALGRAPSEETLLNARHLESAGLALAAIEGALAALREGVPLDLAGVDLRQALHHLGAITGEAVDEQVLDRIFETFCVGK